MCLTCTLYTVEEGGRSVYGMLQNKAFGAATRLEAGAQCSVDGERPASSFKYNLSTPYLSHCLCFLLSLYDTYLLLVVWRHYLGSLLLPRSQAL